MQKSNVDFYPVLLLSILADTLLRLHTGYWARAGLLALPASAAVLAAVLLLVSTSWQGNTLLQKVLCVLLAISSALEILRLHALFGSVYPGTLGLAGTCFVVLAPVIYLRREPALRQTASSGTSSRFCCCPGWANTANPPASVITRTAAAASRYSISKSQ